MRQKARAKQIKKKDSRRSKRFFDDDIEDWMVGQPLDPDKE